MEEYYKRGWRSVIREVGGVLYERLEEYYKRGWRSIIREVGGVL